MNERLAELCCVQHGRSWIQTPTNACGHVICKYMDRKDSTASLDVASQVNLRITQVEKHASDSPCTRSPKQGYQSPYKKDVCPPNFVLKKSF